MNLYIFNRIFRTNNIIIVYDLFDSPDNNNKLNKKISIIVNQTDNNLVKKYVYLSAYTYYVSIKNTIETFETTPNDGVYKVIYYGHTGSTIVDTHIPDNGCNNDLIVSAIYFNKPK